LIELGGRPTLIGADGFPGHLLETTFAVEEGERPTETFHTMESLPDAVLLLILEKIKGAETEDSSYRASSNKKFIKSVASINKRFQRLCMTNSLWRACDFYPKGCMMWLIKHVDLSSVSFDTTLCVYLEEFSRKEIITAFGKLGPYVKDIELKGYGRLDGHDMVFNGFTCSILKRCSNLSRLQIRLPDIAVDTLIDCIKGLPLLADLLVDDVSDDVMPLINTLSERCPALTALSFSQQSSSYIFTYDRDLFKITGLVELFIGDAELQAEFFWGPVLSHFAGDGVGGCSYIMADIP